jgi:hypothetical protein
MFWQTLYFTSHDNIPVVLSIMSETEVTIYMKFILAVRNLLTGISMANKYKILSLQYLPELVVFML